MAAQGPRCTNCFSNGNRLLFQHPFLTPPGAEREIAHAHTMEMETPAECTGPTMLKFIVQLPTGGRLQHILHSLPAALG